MTPVQIPIEPQDLDATRPADIDLCPWCWGAGEREIRTGYRVCGWCFGTGER